MMDTPDRDSARIEALTDLIEFRRPVAEAIQQLGQFPWDCATELVELGMADVIAALESHLRGELDEHDLESWAEALAGRDDVGMRAGQAGVLTEALFELSSPELFGPPATTVPVLLERLRDA
jgi:hypothetical protein